MLRQIKRLYKNSFPRNERKSFRRLLRARKKGTAEILAAVDENGSFCGHAIFVLYGDLVLLDYFAVCPERRDQGIGSVLMQQIQERFSDKKLFLEIELPDPKNDASGVKQRRKEFYLRCGMSETGLRVKLFGVDLEILSFRCGISFAEYLDLYRKMAGTCADRFVILLESRAAS